MENTEFKDRNCQYRCDKDSSCTGYLLPRIAKQNDDYDYNWCTTYTSTGLTGNGREDYDCWIKGTLLVWIIIIGLVHLNI